MSNHARNISLYLYYYFRVGSSRENYTNFFKNFITNALTKFYI